MLRQDNQLKMRLVVVVRRHFGSEHFSRRLNNPSKWQKSHVSSVLSLEVLGGTAFLLTHCGGINKVQRM